MPPDPDLPRIAAPPLRRAWACLTATLQVDERLSAEVWQAVARSAHPHARALKYHLARLQEQPSPARTWAAFGQGGALEARRLIELMEVLVQERRLARAAASRFQDDVLRFMDHDGVWR